MARLRLLGGPEVEDIPCICIESDADLRHQEEHAAMLRNEAKTMHERWLSRPGDVEAKEDFALALGRWATYVGDRRAQDHAYRLLNGLPLGGK